MLKNYSSTQYKSERCKIFYLMFYKIIIRFVGIKIRPVGYKILYYQSSRTAEPELHLLLCFIANY